MCEADLVHVYLNNIVVDSASRHMDFSAEIYKAWKRARYAAAVLRAAD